MLNFTARPFLHLRSLRLIIPTTSSLSDYGLRRNFSVQAIYSTFPVSLLRYNPGQRSSLFDVKDLEQRGDDPYDDAVKVSSNNLVYPGAEESSSLTNGAVFMPNTYTTQEIVRENYDYYKELEEAGKDIELPYIFRIPKGTLIPNNLVLFHENTGRFSLQPSRAMPLAVLNESLDEFYAKYAEKETVEQWLAEHPFQSAVADDQYTKWIMK